MVQDLAAELDGELGWRALEARHDGDLDALVILRFFACLVFEVIAHGSKDAIGHQDAEEGPNQCGADMMAEYGRLSPHMAHSDHHAHNGRDDPEAGQTFGQFADGTGHQMRFGMVGFEFAVEEGFQVISGDTTQDDHAQVVDDEVHGAVYFFDLAVLLEDGTFGGCVDVLLDTECTFTSDLGEDVEQQCEQFQVEQLLEG